MYSCDTTCTIPTEIDFPRYNMKCSGDNLIQREIVHVVSCFPLHFMLYRGYLDYFSDSVCLRGYLKPLNVSIKGTLFPLNLAAGWAALSAVLEEGKGQGWYTWLPKSLFPCPVLQKKADFIADLSWWYFINLTASETRVTREFKNECFSWIIVHLYHKLIRR